jgi:FAD dependent oxidoreductase TIGR03364
MASIPHAANGDGLRRRDPAHVARPRVAIVGAGIVGLAHAWAAARRGWRVLLFERDPRAVGASIRNFGMVWPIGQPPGTLHRTALASRQLWDELVEAAGLWSSRCGSLHLAYRPDEMAVIQEFAKLAPAVGIECELLAADAALALSPAARRDGLLGGMASHAEMCVDPRQVVARAPQWLHEKYGVELHFGVPIDAISRGTVVAADRTTWSVDRIVVAAGADVRLLYPDFFAQAGFRRCKLQMMRTAPQPPDWTLGPMLAGGLTLRHYAAFGACRSLDALKERVARETPELNRFGIHVMAAQNGHGEVILGDSHEYDDQITPFDKAEIDELVLRELRRMIDLPDWTIRERWHGVYPVAPNTVEVVAEPEPNVHLTIASGGCGMTMSFGLAEEKWIEWAGTAASSDERRLAAVAGS